MNRTPIPPQMKALMLTGFGKKLHRNLSFQQLDTPTPEPNQILVEIHAASLNPIDYKIVEGLLRLVRSFDLPEQLGFDVAGIVIAKGTEVDQFEIGDEIYARVSGESRGTFAEYIAVDAELAAPMPLGLSFEEAASIPLVGLTTVQSFRWAGLKANDRVLIHAGSGGIGTFAIQYAKALGATVYTTTSTPNVGWVKALGADQVIDYKQEDYRTMLQDLDIVYDTLGSGYTKDAFSVIRSGGSVVTIVGDPDAEAVEEMGLNAVLKFALGLKRRPIDRAQRAKAALYRFIAMNPNAEDLMEITRWIEAGNIRPVIDRTFALDDAVEALTYLQTGRAKGKVVLKVR
ncbi:NADP-dependent oxidoreductase [Pontibacter sp. G13]|uniref:NADP-dependent oxidoreductase n=1 Tax=Pontibacter sp. G13 TaxID=3074898 RepID=UPI0028893960|nr:NADP-dependent oxidoreductase [Pontibacter sp. G13]WNJ20121.1 NADP-dependent oxidoreductase [Pontibacter sp. G13]